MNPFDEHNLFCSRWYSVRHSKPKVGQRVLVCNKVGHVNIGEREAKRRLGSYWSVPGGVMMGVTHWAVLPNPASRRRVGGNTNKEKM